MGHVLVYDLETKKTFDEVGGQRNPHLLGISVAGVYNYTDNQFHALRENQLDVFAELLQDCDLLIGFNSRHFDNKVLQPYLPGIAVDSIPHVDMLEVVANELGFRVKLDNIAQTTLAEGKSGSGLDAIRYFRLGEWDKLEKYCLDDVRVTRDVYEYGRTHGYVWFTESGTPTKVSVNWGERPFVDDVIEEAHANHQQVEVEYIDAVGTGSQARVNRYTTVLDIRNIDDNRITAFSKTDQKQKIFDQAKIMTAQLNGSSAAHQATLI